MERKLYEILLRPNTNAILWIDDGVAYHDQDPNHPYPYDAACNRYLWDKEIGLRRNEPYREYPLRYVLPLFSFPKLEMAKGFVQDCFDCADAQAGEKSNVIVVYRKYGDNIIVGAGYMDGITNDTLSWKGAE